MWVITMDVDWADWGSTHFKISFPAFFPVFPAQLVVSQGSTCWEFVSCLEVETEKHPVCVGAWVLTRGRQARWFTPREATVFLPFRKMPGGGRWWGWSDLPRPEDSQSWNSAWNPAQPRVTNLANPYKSKDEPTHNFLLQTWLPFFSWASHNDSRNGPIGVLRLQFILSERIQISNSQNFVTQKKSS